MKSPQKTVDLRQVNSQAILRQLYFHEPTSRLELSSQTKLSPSTITNVIGELLQSEILIEAGLEESLGGRPRAILEINPQYGYLIGVDLGETLVQLELFDFTRHKLGTIQEAVDARGDPIEHYTRIISENCQKLIRSAGISYHEVLGLGIGVPGVVGHDKRVTVAAPMWGWRPVSLLDMVEKEARLPVYIDNGAKAMALAESWFGAGRGVKDMAAILIGTGVGAGIITRGSLTRGATNSAGEWGHTKIVVNGRPCRCGSRGCLEAYVGAPGILTSLWEANQRQSTVMQDQFQALHEFVQAYLNKEPTATQIMQTTVLFLGIGIANLVNLFNPESIVIGGWAGILMGKFILEELTDVVKKYALAISTENLRIGLCQFGQDAVCIGAACLVLEQLLSGNAKFSRREMDAQLPNVCMIDKKTVSFSREEHKI